MCLKTSHKKLSPSLQPVYVDPDGLVFGIKLDAHAKQAIKLRRDAVDTRPTGRGRSSLTDEFMNRVTNHTDESNQVKRPNILVMLGSAFYIRDKTNSAYTFLMVVLHDQSDF